LVFSVEALISTLRTDSVTTLCCENVLFRRGISGLLSSFRFLMDDFIYIVSSHSDLRHFVSIIKRVKGAGERPYR